MKPVGARLDDVKMCNMDVEEAGLERKLQMQELDKMRLEAYESSRIYKKKTKLLHDKKIIRKDFKVGDRVLLYKARFKLLKGKLKDNWYGPFIVTKFHPFGMVEILDETTGKEFPLPYLQSFLFFPLASDFSLYHHSRRREAFPPPTPVGFIPDPRPTSREHRCRPPNLQLPHPPSSSFSLLLTGDFTVSHHHRVTAPSLLSHSTVAHQPPSPNPLFLKSPKPWLQHHSLTPSIFASHFTISHLIHLSPSLEPSRAPFCSTLPSLSHIPSPSLPPSLSQVLAVVKLRLCLADSFCFLEVDQVA
ncbi:hypothetical protein QN277_029281 [Acacia crassicarpa]|uniref:Reverse transcriptase domain-containing protein n=1 Tax=Acacia crassicarpa TaxID=499986 RepID=A0AAE1J508_9FABA|nr:hypothetical protein QN277_029281 [Acacia crassicarpa]